MNALTQLSNLPETRAEQHTFVHAAIEELMNGEHDLMKFWVQASILADTLNEIKESLLIKRMVLEEANKYKGTKAYGCDINVKSKRSYDYSVCNHPKWQLLKQEEKDLKESIKEIESMLKTLKNDIADVETGDVISPPNVSVSEYVAVT